MQVFAVLDKSKSRKYTRLKRGGRQAYDSLSK
jgi:hypothetical protein